VSTFSTVSLVPPLREHATVVDLIVMRHLLEQRRGRLVGGSHLVETEGDEIWRITLRSRLFGGLPRNELMRGIRSQTNATLDGWDESPAVVFTGGSQIFYETQHDVLSDFAQNLISAYAMIFVMNSCVLRSIRAGLISMLPNVVPCLTVFGLLGWIDGGVDIGMTVAGCIALGIAVDNTAHFVLLYRENLRSHPTRQEALRVTYLHAATSVFQTSIICGLSMLPYALSDMLYLSRFGVVMSAMMFGAAFSDLLLTPSLISTRLGRCFDGRKSPPTPTAPAWDHSREELPSMDPNPA
jgi:hypothetical protein